MPTKVEALRQRMFDVNALYAAGAIMDWDQQTMMPKGGAAARAAHSGILSRMAHERFTSDETARLLEEATNEVAPGTEDAALVRVVRRDFDQSTKLPSAFVEEKSRLSSEAHEKWVQARETDSFATFAPTLEQMFSLARQEADYYGWTGHRYDALLDCYEEGWTAVDVQNMFGTIREPMVRLVEEIRERGQSTDAVGLNGTWDNNRQRKFSEHLIHAIGFDTDRGRLDTAPHPFCTGWSVTDIRLTTRFKDMIGSAIFGSLHEAGHGMYEQGSPLAWDRTPLAGGVSLGVHESQSRLWENIVGRSLPFWRKFLPELHANFPNLAAFDVDTFYRMINQVEPSLIRVEADEVTYNLHILIRFELEMALLAGEMQVADLPEAWRAKYQQYLGITPETDKEGCLQDVHWSMGGIGYFPTYTIGNLLSFQIWRKLTEEIPNTDDLIAVGNFAPILGWLQDRIYRHGRYYTPKELVLQATGKPLDANDYLAGITAKYRSVYSL